MSEKRLITKEQIQQVYQRLSDYGDDVIEDIQDMLEYLPAPTLADVCGKRELKDMTEMEFEELLARIDPHEDEFELPIEFGDDLQHHYYKQIRIIRWFIEHGFNIIEVEND